MERGCNDTLDALLGPGEAAGFSDEELDDSLLGVWVLDQFRILRILARGGMAQVYLAEQPGMERLAAVKIMRPSSGLSRDWAVRFRQEARAASRLQHPNIVSVYNFGELGDGSLFLAMEYLEGEALGSLLQRTSLPPRQALAIARQCAAALEHAHSRGIIHRDFKPDNVILSSGATGEVVKVLDFGIARVIGDASQTQAGLILGTPRYMGPEQCRGELATARSDQYALGLVLYEMLAGEPAISADSPIGFLHAHQNQPVIPPSRVRPLEAVEVIDPIVMRMLAKSPEDRFPDLAEVLRQLDAALPLISEGPESASGAARPRPPTGPVPTDVLMARTRSGRRQLIQVRRAGLEVLDEAGWATMSERGLRLAGTEQAGDLWVIGLEGDARVQHSGSRLPAGCPVERSLVCIDADLERAGLAAATEPFTNVLIGQLPADPTVLSVALSWLHRSFRGMEGLLSERSVQLVQISSSTQKGGAVDALLEDAAAEGLRPSVLQGLAELGEEMILNAIFHAPRDRQGASRYAHLDRAAPVSLRPGEEATLRWCILRRFVVVSVRDRFGSLKPAEVLARVTGPHPGPDLHAAGSGMGLRIMSRAARHLFFAICPGHWCEVLALVAREPGDSWLGRRSLCVLQNLARKALQLGDRLQATEVQEHQLVRISLVGEINESSNLRPVFKHSGLVMLDLSGVTRINSVGIRAWIDALRSRPPAAEVVLEACSLASVRQINMVPALTEGIRVASILAPYCCPVCQADSIEKLEVAELQGVVAPPRSCRRCGGRLQLDGLPEEYFSFRP